MDFDWSVISQYRSELLSGFWLTIVYTIASSVLGMTWGTLLALARLSSRAWLRMPATVVLEVVRGVPLLVLLIWFYYAFPLLTQLSLSPMAAAIISLSLYGGSYYGEIVRGGILSVEAGQTDAALSLGMTYAERMRRVVLPQAFRRMVPPLVNQTIIQLKNTSLASIVTVAELVYQAQAVSARTYRPLEVYTAVALLYLVLVLPASAVSRRLELKNSRYGSSGARRRRTKVKVGVVA